MSRYILSLLSILFVVWFGSVESKFLRKSEFIVQTDVASASPTFKPSKAPTSKTPTAAPTFKPTASPTVPGPTRTPTRKPTIARTITPTKQPTTRSPTPLPTATPTRTPTTASPTFAPSMTPSREPTQSPSFAPSTASPTLAPSRKPTAIPTTMNPTVAPTVTPTRVPTAAKATSTPTAKPTWAPTTVKPTTTPTRKPTAAPISKSPTNGPTLKPTFAPSSKSPSAIPSFRPTAIPSTRTPTDTPTTAAPSISLAPSYSLAPTLPPLIYNSSASWTYYNAYPRCCPNQANYDPSYPTTECVSYNGCAHPGKFAAIGQRSLDFVESTDIIAFYDNSDPTGSNFYSKWANKYITITGTCKGITKTFTALIADTCGNSDCNNCCARNSNPSTGFLIDMEYYTAMRQFGATDCADALHNVTFAVNLNAVPAIPNCGGTFGACNGAQQCCSADGYCSTSSEACGVGCQKDYGSCAGRVGGCGPVGGNGCPTGTCCSKYGYCGIGDAYCGDGCQAGYGLCITATPTLTPTTSVPTISIAPTYSMRPTRAPLMFNSTSSWTYYNAYPKCCKDQPNYDPTYPTTECVSYSGCRHPGKFAAIGQRSFDFVQSTNIIAFYDNSDPTGSNFYAKWANKYVTITGTCKGITKTFTALIADTCGNSDCNNCCARNSNPSTGFLIDTEYYTIMRQFGTTDCADAIHSLSFSLNLNQPSAIPDCGGEYGACNGAQRCCSADGFCGSTDAECGAGCQVGSGYCASNPNTCGPVAGKSCPTGQCCSKWGYCGSTMDYCGSGCIGGYGLCITPRPTASPTTAVPSISPAPSISFRPSFTPLIFSSTSSWTYYNAYPRCCPDQANYDPYYPTTECVSYSGCRHPGKFAAIGQRSLEYTQANDLVALYDNSDPTGSNFYSKWANKYITITGTCKGITKTFTALIADTCGNSDCNNCCARNSNPSTGFLIDMEYYTAMRQFGTTDCADVVHTLSFQIDLNQAPAISNCGGEYGECTGAQRCCSADGFCGSTDAECGAGCQSGYGYCASNENTCGPIPGNSCPIGQCCSKWGYCGTGSDYCGSGCMIGYGKCWSSTKSPTKLPTFSPTLSPTSS